MEETTHANVVESRIRANAYVKPEGMTFFREHGCDIQSQQDESDIVIFPPGSRQEPLSATSKRCSHIFLPDGTCITAMDCYTRFIFLIMNPVHGYCIHLST